MFCQIHGYGCNGMCMQQMSAQQQMSNQLTQYYNQLAHNGQSTSSRVQETRDSIPEEKKPNKILLLLR